MADGPHGEPLPHHRCARRRRRSARRPLGRFHGPQRPRRDSRCRARRSADPRGDGIPPVLAVGGGAPGWRAGDRARPARTGSEQRAQRARGTGCPREGPRRGSRRPRSGAGRRGRALDGRVRRARAGRAVPRARLEAGARGRRSAAGPARGAVCGTGHPARARADRRAAGDALRVRRRVPRLLARASRVPARLVAGAGGILRYDLVGRRPICVPRPATRRSKRTRSTRTPAPRSWTRSRDCGIRRCC